MDSTKNISWFKSIIEPTLSGFEINYRSFDDGDFGSLNQVEFNSEEKGGNVDFWGLGWLGIFLWDYKKEEEIMNVLLGPEQEKEKEIALEKFQSLLK